MSGVETGRSVAVLGGGIAGLTVALNLAKCGHRVTVLEAASECGGLGKSFEVLGASIERHYHVLSGGDVHLVQLLADLHLAHELYWRRATSAAFVDGTLYHLDGARSVVTFRVVPWLSRVRLGCLSLLARFLPDSSLDSQTALDFLLIWTGYAAVDTLLKPLLQFKFGPHFRDAPALWYVARNRRERGHSGQVCGYLPGGYRRIIDELLSSLATLGVKVETGVPVESVGRLAEGMRVRITGGPARDFDKLVLALPLPVVQGLLDDSVAETRQQLPRVDYQGAINVVVALKRGVSRHLSTAVIRSGTPFDGIVETTNVIRSDDVAGMHLIYLVKYAHRTSPEFARSDSEIKQSYLEGLLRLWPELQEDDVLALAVFRAPYVEPLVHCGYLSTKPRHCLVPGRLYLATTAQLYPRVNTWDAVVANAITLAREVCGC